MAGDLLVMLQHSWWERTGWRITHHPCTCADAQHSSNDCELLASRYSIQVHDMLFKAVLSDKKTRLWTGACSRLVWNSGWVDLVVHACWWFTENLMLQLQHM